MKHEMRWRIVPNLQEFTRKCDAQQAAEALADQTNQRVLVEYLDVAKSFTVPPLAERQALQSGNWGFQFKKWRVGPSGREFSSALDAVREAKRLANESGESVTVEFRDSGQSIEIQPFPQSEADRKYWEECARMEREMHKG